MTGDGDEIHYLYAEKDIEDGMYILKLRGLVLKPLVTFTEINATHTYCIHAGDIAMGLSSIIDDDDDSDLSYSDLSIVEWVKYPRANVTPRSWYVTKNVATRDFRAILLQRSLFRLKFQPNIVTLYAYSFNISLFFDS